MIVIVVVVVVVKNELRMFGFHAYLKSTKYMIKVSFFFVREIEMRLVIPDTFRSTFFCYLTHHTKTDDLYLDKKR